jgi:hypothetical protein
VPIRRERSVEKTIADDLVDRVVSADILAEHDQFPAGVEQRRRVQAAGAVERLLRRPHLLRQACQEFRVDPHVGLNL